MTFGELLFDGASDSGVCDLEGCNRATQYEGPRADRGCKRCFDTEGREHDPCCDKKARDDNDLSDAKTEDIMSGDENGQNARSHPASAEEGDTTTATRAAAAAAQETDVCSVCQYRGRKLKHT